MSWDDTKSAYDDILSADWNAMVTDQKTRRIPQRENKRGSDCSGSSGAGSRTLTLSNTETTISNSELVVKNGTVLHETADYTISHLSSSSVITFTSTMIVFDSDYIMVMYATDD